MKLYDPKTHYLKKNTPYDPSKDYLRIRGVELSLQEEPNDCQEYYEGRILNAIKDQYEPMDEDLWNLIQALQKVQNLAMKTYEDLHQIKENWRP